MVTDRPDFTESSEVIPLGLLQLEAGLTYEGNEAARNVSVPSALVRIGLGHRAELRLGADGFLSQIDSGIRTSGFSDIEVGLKIRLLDQRRVGFDLALIPMASLPTGTAGFTSDGTDPTLKITLARELPGGVGLSGNVNFSSISDDAGRFTQRALSLSVGYDLQAGWGAFAEVYGFSPIDRDEAPGVTLDWGLSRVIGRNLQFDVEGGRGLTSAAPDWFLGAGFAVRSRIGRR